MYPGFSVDSELADVRHENMRRHEEEKVMEPSEQYAQSRVKMLAETHGRNGVVSLSEDFLRLQLKLAYIEGGITAIAAVMNDVEGESHAE
jgi:hypothetical protein